MYRWDSPEQAGGKTGIAVRPISQLPQKRTYAGATNVQFVPTSGHFGTIGLIFEFELFELPHSARDRRLGHSR
jgi:hypothetical protein